MQQHRSTALLALPRWIYFHAMIEALLRLLLRLLHELLHYFRD